MSNQSLTARKTAGQGRWVSIVLTTAFVLFAAVWAIDEQFLPTQTATATVMGKNHYDMTRTYVTEKIGNTFRPVPHVISQQFILKLRVGKKVVDWPTDRERFRTIQPGQQVQVRYQKRRLTGVTTALSIESK